ncbi:MAG: putative bifunctional diguanylate cyclase/phosphodiesterase [Janthinobacterium lividum]
MNILPSLSPPRGQATGQDHLWAAFDAVPGGLLTFDAAHQVCVTNQRLHTILGIPAGIRAPGSALSWLLARSSLLPAAIEQLMRAIHDRDGGGNGPLTCAADRGARMINVQLRSLPNAHGLIVFEDVTHRLAAEAEALSDPLTGLLNRRLFLERVALSLNPAPTQDPAASRARIPAVLLIDLDRFKSVNDTFGHSVGDSLLQQVAKRLRAVLRKQDVIARLGGGEFAALIMQKAGTQDMASLASRIMDALGRPYLADGHLVTISASIGIAPALDHCDKGDTLIRNAGLALSHAKAAGRGACSFFEPAMNAQAAARRTLEIDLRKALSLRQFELYFQPQIDLASETVTGFEALVRWHNPSRGLVSPAEFIPLAEEIGLIVPLGEWVLREACRTAMTWPEHISVAVNVSPVQFEDPARLIAMVGTAITTAGLPGSRLELEITESVLLRNEGKVLRALHELRAMGIRIAMDDFGTGYSSLSQLHSFPFDKIKIDRSFVTGHRKACVGDVDRATARATGQNAVIRAITALGVSLGMSTIAEGVETTDQLDLIRSEGCRSVQGYLFSQPVPASQVGALITAFTRPAPLAVA